MDEPFALTLQLSPELAGQETLATEVRACRRCSLSAAQGVRPTPWTFNFNPPAPFPRVLLLAEAPGAKENAYGAPLIGPAGKCLDRMLVTAGLDPSAFSRGNVANCYPMRAPTPEEVSACQPHFLAGLRLLRPKAILVLGSVALRALYPGLSVSGAHGLWWREPDLPGQPWCMAVFHPAYVLRQFSQAKIVVEDMKTFRTGLERIIQARAPESGRDLCAVCRQPGEPRFPKFLPLCPKHLPPEQLVLQYFPGAVIEVENA